MIREMKKKDVLEVDMTHSCNTVVTDKHFKMPLCLIYVTAIVSQLLFFTAVAHSNVQFEGNLTLTAVSIASIDATSMPPQTVINYTNIDSKYTFSASIPDKTAGPISQYKWDFGDGDISTGNPVVHEFTTQAVFPVTLAVTYDSGDISLTQTTIDLTPPTSPPGSEGAAINIAINFQPASATPPSEYKVDANLPFDNAVGYGWIVGANSLKSQNINISSSPDEAYDTMINIQLTSVWELEVPNGNYSVRVAAYRPKANLTIEGVTVINYSSSPKVANATLWREDEVTVEVSDGKLTLTVDGNYAVDLCWIKITSL